MKKIIILLTSFTLLSGCTNPLTVKNEPTTSPVETSAPTDAPTEAPVQYIPVDVSSESNADGMTKVASFDMWCLSEDDSDTITLYTSAKKYNGEFEWDDSSEWLLEISGADGNYYTLFDNRVSLGSIYFDVAEFDEKTYILLRNISTASSNTEVYCVNDGEYCKTNELDLNDLSEYNVNLLYTSTPSY